MDIRRLFVVIASFLAFGALIAVYAAESSHENAPGRLVLKTGQRQLFLDDFVIADLNKIKRIIHPVEKHPGNPVIAPDIPTDGTVIELRSGPEWDPVEECWKIWYGGGNWVTAMARSKDGIHWGKPNLGVVERDGSKNNNLVTVEGHPEPYKGGPTFADPSGFIYHVIIDHEAKSAHRYKAVAGIHSDRRPAVSADGRTFKILPVPPILSQDQSALSWDDIQKQYLLTVKHDGPYGRSVYLSVSKDFEQWSPPELIFHADTYDQVLGEHHIRKQVADPRMLSTAINEPSQYKTEIYNMPIYTYEGIYIGFPSYFEVSGRIPLPHGNQDGTNSVKLAVSRDLKKWTPIGDRTHFIPLSENIDGAIDTMQLLMNSSPIRIGDELWFYYTGINYRGPRTDVGVDSYRSAIYLAKLRLDGFVSLRSTGEGAFIETRPMQFDGKRLYLNLKTTRGRISAEVLDSSGQRVLDGWSRDRSLAVSGDQLRAELRWEGKDLSELHGKRVRFRFYLEEADLYSFWFGP